MADCNDLYEQRQKLLAQKRDMERQLKENRRSIDLDLDQAPPSAAAPVVFRTRKPGEKVVLTPKEVDRQLQYAMKQAQSSAVAEQVERGFRMNEKPNGALGRFVNYSRLTPDQENVAKLLEAFSIARKDLMPEIHTHLTKKFTARDAAEAILDTQQDFIKDREGLLQEMVRQVRGLEYLPEIVTRVRVIKEDAAAAFLDATEAMVRQGEANPGIDVDTKLTNDAWAAGKWALVLNHLDDFAKRKVAQAQVSRQFKGLSPDRLFSDFDAGRVTALSREQVNPKTLMGQIMLHIDQGDIQGLKNLLTRARSLQKTGELDLEADWFNQHMRDISVLRKDGMLSGIQTLAYRNPVSGVGMLFAGAARQGIDASLRLGSFKGLAIAATSMRELLGNLDVGFKLAKNSLTNGGSVMELRLERIANEAGTHVKADEHAELISRLLNQPVMGNPAQRAAIVYGKIYAAWRTLLSDVAFKGALPKLPALRAMGAADEMIRWAAYTNSVRLGAEVEALETLGKDASRKAIDDYIDNAIQQATFSGTVTPDDLRAYRRSRGLSAANAPDEEIVQRIANELVGAPTLNTPLSQRALEESRIATGTQSYPDNPGGRLLAAIDRNRQESWVTDQFIPFFRNPMNMFMFTVDTALPVRPATSVAVDTGRIIYDRLTKGSTDVKVNTLAASQVILSGAMFSGWVVGHAMGIIRGGGPQDPQRRQEWLRFNRPYSIGPEGQKAAQLSLAGIDPFDVLFTWSDVADLAAEGKISIYDQQTMVTGIGEALARIVRRKAAFATVSRFLEWINDPVRNKVTDVLALTAGSYVPQIGNQRDLARVIEPDDRPLRTQPISAEERYQLGDDRLNALVQSLKDFTYQANPLLAVIGQAPRDRDWLGTRVKRPLGIAVDALLPFMPVLMPDSPVHQWLLDNGIAMKPRSNGKLEGVTMTPEIEDRYRTLMREVVASPQLPPSVRLRLSGDAAMVSFAATKSVMTTVNGVKMPIKETVSESVDISPIVDRLTAGRNMHDALLALKNDPWYQSIESDPDLSTRPDIRDLPRSLRRRGITQKLVNTIVTYYDRLAMDQMRNSSHPVDLDWHQRELALSDAAFEDQLQLLQTGPAKVAAGLAAQ